MTDSPEGRRVFRMLIAEDDQAQLNVLLEIFKAEGFDAIGSATAKQALDHLGEGGVDVAVIDLHLPDMGQQDLLETLAAFSERVPIIIHTGYGSYDSVKQAVNFGVFAFVEKRGDPADLLRHVFRAVQIRLLQRAEELETAVAGRTEKLERSNEALRRVQTDLAQAQRIARIGNWTWDVPTGAAIWSDETYRIFGLEPGEVEPSYELCKSATHPDDIELWEDAIARAVESGNKFQLAYRIIRDGKTIWIENDAEIARDERGVAQRFFGTVQDITNRKRAEESLRASNQFVQQVIHGAGEGIIVYGRDLRYQVWNPFMERLLGVAARDVLGRHPLEVFPFLKDVGVMERIERALAGEISGAVDFPWSVSVAGRSGWVSDTCSPLRDADGQIIGVISTVRDITERKEAEQNLLLRDRAVNAAAEGISITDANQPGSPTIFVNSGFERMTGYRVEEVLGRNMRFLQGPATDPATVQQLRQAVEQGQAVTVELLNNRKDGSPFWNRVAITPVRDESGAVTHFIGIHADVTRQRREQERTKLSLEILQHLNSGAGKREAMAGILKRIADFTGFDAVAIRLREGNDFPYFETTGFPDHFVEQERFLCARDVTGELIRDSGGDPVLECICGNVLSHRVDRSEPFFTSGGSFWTNSTTELLASTTGEQLGPRVRGHCRDEGYESMALIPVRSDGATTGLLQLNHRCPGQLNLELVQFLEELGHSIGIALHRADAAEALEASEARLSAIYHHSHLNIALISAEGKVLLCNPACVSSSGYSADELTQASLEDLTYAGDLPKEVFLLQEVLAGKRESYDIQKRNICKDGTLRWFHWHATAIRDGHGKLNGLVMVGEDITARKRWEEQLRHTQKMEAVGQLAAGVAHEFNNLLFGILGSAELLLTTQRDSLSGSFGRALRDIKKCGQRGAVLTKQLLSFARKKSPEVSQFDVNDLIREIDVVLQRMVGDAFVLEIDLTPRLPLIEADRGEVEQTIINLVRNACDAMSGGGTLTIRTSIHVLSSSRVRMNPQAHPGRFVKLSVADTGCGMEPETIDRIFEPFFTTKPVGQGTGLGLSTVFADVTGQGGIIEVESQPGAGSVFRVYLPVANGPVASSRELMRHAEDRCLGGSETILIVDDDQVVLDASACLLERQGYSVICAPGAAEALEVAASHDGDIQLLLTDVSMPEMSGWELARKLSLQRSEMRVIYMSGYAESVLGGDAAGAGQIAFLEKPVESETLYRRVREVLDDGY